MASNLRFFCCFVLFVLGIPFMVIYFADRKVEKMADKCRAVEGRQWVSYAHRGNPRNTQYACVPRDCLRRADDLTQGGN